MRTRSWATSLITISLLGAAPAYAGTIEYVLLPAAPGYIDTPDPYFVFTGGPGEANDITVERLDFTGFRLLDLGAPTTGCPADGASAVLCRGDHELRIKAGDGDDRVVVDTGRTVVDGGPGADRLRGMYLTGGDGDDVLESIEGTPQLDGGRGRDRFLGGPYGDAIVAGDGEPDIVDGGGGEDIVVYRDAPSGVRVDLATDTASDGDVLANVESVFGSAHADHLLGDDGANIVDGLGGDDRLEGRGGDDTLRTGGLGSPSLLCGPGVDRVDVWSRRTARLRDCETLSGHGADLRFTRRGFVLTGTGDTGERSCRLAVTVDGRTRELRRWNGVRITAPLGATVRLRASDRCRGPYGRTFDPIRFVRL